MGNETAHEPGSLIEVLRAWASRPLGQCQDECLVPLLRKDIRSILIEIDLMRKEAATTLKGLRGTSRTPGRDEVVVEFTDDGWEACKRLLELARQA